MGSNEHRYGGLLGPLENWTLLTGWGAIGPKLFTFFDVDRPAHLLRDLGLGSGGPL